MCAGPSDAGRIHVLFLLVQMQMGGAERIVLDLVRSLDKDVFAPSVGWFYEPQPLPEFAELGIPLFHIPKRPGLDWRAMGDVARIVKDNRIEVVNAHHFMPFVYAYYATKVTRRARLVYTDHSEADVRSAAGPWRVIGSCLVASADAAIGVSGKVTEAMRAQFPIRRSHLRTIENGVDIGRFTRRQATRDSVRLRLGLSPTDVVAGIVANLKKNKNHLFLLRAFREVSLVVPEARLLIIGQGFPGDPDDSQTEIEAYIAANGLQERVRLLGYQRDVAELLHAIDVFCLVSRTEGLPISMIEAMAAGLPVVGTAIAGIKPLVTPGENGWLVEPDDVSGLAGFLSGLMMDPSLRGRMGDSSRRFAATRFSLERCAAETGAVLRSAVRRHS